MCCLDIACLVFLKCYFALDLPVGSFKRRFRLGVG